MGRPNSHKMHNCDYNAAVNIMFEGVRKYMLLLNKN